MTTKQNAIDLANTARSFITSLQIKTGLKISVFENEWNVCVKQAGFTGVFDVPNGYKRRAQLIADLEKMSAQLDDYVEPVETKSVVQYVREFNSALTRVLDIEEAHSEALEIDAAMIPVRTQNWWLAHSDEWKLRALERLHLQALEVNVEWDEVTADNIPEVDRDHIADELCAKWWCSNPVVACEYEAHSVNKADFVVW